MIHSSLITFSPGNKLSRFTGISVMTNKCSHWIHFILKFLCFWGNKWLSSWLLIDCSTRWLTTNRWRLTFQRWWTFSLCWFRCWWRSVLRLIIKLFDKKINPYPFIPEKLKRGPSPSTFFGKEIQSAVLHQFVYASGPEVLGFGFSFGKCAWRRFHIFTDKG